jgi:hypothetical protein
MPLNMVMEPWPLYIYSQGVACLAGASHLGLHLAILCSR